jgi:glucokinase
MKLRLGIDIGGTSAKIALVNSAWRILAEGSVQTAGSPNPVAIAEEMAAVCLRLSKGKEIEQVGVGVAGDIDSKKGIIRVSPNLGWKKVPLKSLLERRLRMKVVVDNDANAAAWGVYRTQIPAAITDLVVMTLGTGVGGGVIINGQLLKGATGSAGEIGHMNIDENGPLCNCGNRGCLETYVGRPHIEKKVRTALENGQKSSLQAAFQSDPDQITPRTIAHAANAGDEYALSVWRDVGHALGVAIGDLIYLLNPQMICFTGGVAQAKDLYLKPLWETLRRRAFQTPIRAVRIKVAPHAAHIGVVGAALL